LKRKVPLMLAGLAVVALFARVESASADPDACLKLIDGAQKLVQDNLDALMGLTPNAPPRGKCEFLQWAYRHEEKLHKIEMQRLNVCGPSKTAQPCDARCLDAKLAEAKKETDRDCSEKK